MIGLNSDGQLFFDIQLRNKADNIVILQKKTARVEVAAISGIKKIRTNAQILF